MFELREIAVSLTFFVLLYCLLSALVAVAWRSLKLLRATERKLTHLFFGLRVLPLVASVVVTFVFVVPSFQLLEPRSLTVDEGIGAMPLALGICALLLIACGCWRVIAAHTQTSRVVAHWLEGAHRSAGGTAACTPAHTSHFVPTRGSATYPGWCRKPTVLVSESTVALLTPDELRVALKHELAHMQSRDNLKKLLFRFCPFPGMAKLEVPGLRPPNWPPMTRRSQP
jgi:Zn-dependent protease with chaperone function